MSESSLAAVHRALATLLSELVDGSALEASWILNPQDPGLRRSLDKLTAAAASAAPPGGGSTVAAHVDHLCYGLELMVRWSRGDNPFKDADYSSSWRRSLVSDEEWLTLRDRLHKVAREWLESVRRPRSLSDTELTAMIASIAHLAYHLGAIRQIDRATRGPLARD